MMRRLGSAALSVACCAALFVGADCGPGKPCPQGGCPEGGGAGGGSGGSGGLTGGDPYDGGDGTLVLSDGGHRTGSVSLATYPSPANGWVTFVVIDFHEGGTPPYSSRTQLGDCVITTDVSQPTPGTARSFGALTIDVNGNPTTVSAGWTVLPRLFSGGEHLRASATGGDVPGFTLAIGAPTPIAVASPLPVSGPDASIPIVLANGRSISWSGGGLGWVEATVSGIGGHYANCRAPVASGSMTLPSAVLNQLNTGPGTLSVSAVTAASGQQGEWPLLFAAGSAGLLPDGGNYVVAVDLK